MKFNDILENYPSPVIAIDSDGFVIAKNYMSSLTFENLHVGAKITKYTDVDFTKCIMSSCIFYGKEYSYFVCKDSIDNNDCYLMFISVAEYGLNFLPFDPVKVYNEKSEALSAETESSEIKNKKRKYVRAVHNNLLRVNYFKNFKSLFSSNAHIMQSEGTVSLSSVCVALEKICDNYLSEANITVHLGEDCSCDNVKISNIILSSVLLNSLCFAVMNSCDTIDVQLKAADNEAEISIEFDSNYDYFALYKGNKEIENSDINSGLALFVATEVSKKFGIDYKILKESRKNKKHFAIIHTFKSVYENKFIFSSKDNIAAALEQYVLSIFFNELD